MENEIESRRLPQRCVDCGQPVSGRIDKKFCDDSCRTHFNNLKKQQKQTAKPVFLKNIQKILIRNYEILKKANTTLTTKISRNKLQQLGFNFRYLTSIHTTAKGDTYRFCFDQGYLELKDGMVLLVVQASQVQ
ncbi:MAG TPA: DUF2116 family Zn-ribbon domain-containing protein [Pedobacter sp.]|nr:DUF2116 family Zn-ribbon domain-containing protein [Pedobacter sp.]